MKNSPICLTCGIRSDRSRTDDLCQNGHNDWLKYWDLFSKRDKNEQDEIMHRVVMLTGWSPEEIKKAFVHPDISSFPINRDIWLEADDIIEGKIAFSWSNIEINDWELGYRMQRMDGDAVCSICNKTAKEHPMETRTKGEPWLNRMCYGIWAKL